MIVQNLQPAPVEIETLGAWRLDGKPVEIGTRTTVLPSLAADLIARGKARLVVAAEPAPADPPPADPPPADSPPAPETPPAPAPAARGKK